MSKGCRLAPPPLPTLQKGTGTSAQHPSEVACPNQLHLNRFNSHWQNFCKLSPWIRHLPSPRNESIQLVSTILPRKWFAATRDSIENKRFWIGSWFNHKPHGCLKSVWPLVLKLPVMPKYIWMALLSRLRYCFPRNEPIQRGIQMLSRILIQFNAWLKCLRKIFIQINSWFKRRTIPLEPTHESTLSSAQVCFWSVQFY